LVPDYDSETLYPKLTSPKTRPEAQAGYRLSERKFKIKQTQNIKEHPLTIKKSKILTHCFLRCNVTNLLQDPDPHRPCGFIF